MASFTVINSEIKLFGLGGAPAWSQLNDADTAQKEAEIVNSDSLRAFPGVFQRFLQGQVGGWLRKDILLMTPELSEIEQVAVRGPGDVFLVMAALTFAKNATDMLGNPLFTALDDPALEQYLKKVDAATEDLLKKPIRPEYGAIANWLGGSGGMAQSLDWNVMSFIDYYAVTQANMIGWNANTYLEPEKITDSNFGQPVNVAKAMINLKALSPWTALWCQERAFGKALNKQADAQANIEQAQSRVLNEVGTVVDASADTMKAIVDAINKAQKNLGSFFGLIGDWIVPIALGAGALWLLFEFAPHIVSKGEETAQAYAKARAKRKSS